MIIMSFIIIVVVIVFVVVFDFLTLSDDCNPRHFHDNHQNNHNQNYNDDDNNDDAHDLIEREAFIYLHFE